MVAVVSIHFLSYLLPDLNSVRLISHENPRNCRMILVSKQIGQGPMTHLTVGPRVASIGPWANRPACPLFYRYGYGRYTLSSSSSANILCLTAAGGRLRRDAEGADVASGRSALFGRRFKTADGESAVSLADFWVRCPSLLSIPSPLPEQAV